jgi:hypothetical protein
MDEYSKKDPTVLPEDDVEPGTNVEAIESVLTKRTIDVLSSDIHESQYLSHASFSSSDATTLSLRDWMEENVGGASPDTVFGMLTPRDPNNVPDLYDRAFKRFKPLVNIGKRKFDGGNILNTATNKDELLTHAQLVAPVFLQFLKEFTDNNPNTRVSSGENNAHLIKSGDGLEFRLLWKDPIKIHDMIRTTVICPSITTLEDAVRKFIVYCQESGKNSLLSTSMTTCSSLVRLTKSMRITPLDI